MKKINYKFYGEVNNEKHIIHDGKIMFETKIPKLLKTRYELMFKTNLTKTQSIEELDDGTLQLIDSKNLTNRRLKSSEN